MLADLANAHLQNGDWQLALSNVREAIQVAIERRMRVPECLARIVHAKILVRTSGDRLEAEEEIERAQELIKETGAELFRRELEDLRTGENTELLSSGVIRTRTKTI
jgi:hypothetical protein